MKVIAPTQRQRQAQTQALLQMPPRMRMYKPADAPHIPAHKVLRALNLELLGLAAGSIVLLFGIALVYAAKAKRLEESGAPGTVISLHALTSPAQLEPVLTMFTSPVERQMVAQELYRRATSTTGSAPALDHVGALADVTVPAATVLGDRRLEQLRTRLDHRPDVANVPLLSRADIVAIKPRLAVRSLAQFNRSLAASVAAFLGAFWLAHVFRRWRGRHDDPLVLPALLLLCGIGMMTMIALRDPLRDTMSADAFAGGVAIGIALLVAASEVDLEASPLRRAVWLPLALALTLAMMLLAFGSGPGTSGAKVNLLGAQPVEVIRLLVVLALAAYFGRRLELLRELSEPATPSRPWLRDIHLPRWRDVRPVLASMGLVLVFFFLQKDLGPALVLSCVFLGLFGLARRRVGLVIAGFAMLLAGFAVAYWTGVPALVRHRVMIWRDPWNNGVPGGNQIAHGLWALSTGGTWGSGAGLGNPTAIPEGYTDFVLAALGEELGYVAIALVVVLYAFLCWRCLRIALRAPGDFSTFLAAGVVLVISVQALVIACGLLGLIPLTGVVTPFLSYGRSSMLANFLAMGLVLSIARRQSQVREHMRQPLRVLGAVLGAAAGIVLLRATWVQVVRADDIASASALTEQADGGYRYEYNPRLLSAARTLLRGTIYDRNKLPLATSRPDEIAALSATYEGAGGVSPEDCGRSEGEASVRCYPLGGFAFHLLGDWTHQTNWAARNSSYVERDSDARLKGYDDRTQLVTAVNPRTGRRQQAIRRDLRSLLPLARHRYQPDSDEVRIMRSRDRDEQMSIDARLQVRVAAALRNGIVSHGYARGAAVVLDANTGEVLAAASYPWPEKSDLERTDRIEAGPPSVRTASGGTPVNVRTRGLRLQAPGSRLQVLLANGRTPDSVRSADDERGVVWLDRARYGLYPPGSTFKLLIAGAALRSHRDTERFTCTRLPDGRVGGYVRGQSRPVRDDPMDTVPHGDVDLERGLIVSCNLYFAQLAQTIGPRPVLDTAALFQIDVAHSPTPEGLRPTLAHVGYGQGEAVVSPLKLARVSASIASGGLIAPIRWEPFTPNQASQAQQPPPSQQSPPAQQPRQPLPSQQSTPAQQPQQVLQTDAWPRFLSKPDADRIARIMRSVVTSGTARALRSHPVAIAGKTGTAEVTGAPAHSWFTGFAPYQGDGRKIAFAVIVENAGYGNRAAAPIAGEIVSAAKELGLIK